MKWLQRLLRIDRRTKAEIEAELEAEFVKKLGLSPDAVKHLKAEMKKRGRDPGKRD